ncbi:MAG: penicillin acylase family protein, partial [Gemmatimonadaceae bacterium]
MDIVNLLSRLAPVGLLLVATTVVAQTSDDPATRVEIRRTAHGVPHIKAQDLRAAAYALAWVQLEDHGPRVAIGILRARGEMGRWFGRDSMESDFFAQRDRRLAVEKYALLDQETRDVYDGFAAGVNRYIEVNPAEFPPDFAPKFTGYDVAAR